MPISRHLEKVLAHAERELAVGAHDAADGIPAALQKVPEDRGTSASLAPSIRRRRPGDLRAPGRADRCPVAPHFRGGGEFRRKSQRRLPHPAHRDRARRLRPRRTQSLQRRGRHVSPRQKRRRHFALRRRRWSNKSSISSGTSDSKSAIRPVRSPKPSAWRTPTCSRKPRCSNRASWPAIRDLARRFREQFRENCVRGHEREYVELRMQDQAARHAKFGDSVYVQEPNLKSGCGGLRDYQNLLWMTFFKEGALTTTHLVGKDWLSEADRKPDRSGLRFSPSPPHRPSLRDRPRHRHPAFQRPGPDRGAARLSAKTGHAPERSVDEGLLRAHAKYFSRDGADHGAIRQRPLLQHDALAL